ncbi:MAG: TRAP transporter substrate-binding protein DctP [Polyangiaceae bacterium]|nr:TRAP transporter substrate-binding protein DctP [Polyangiaceae bacterium]
MTLSSGAKGESRSRTKLVALFAALAIFAGISLPREAAAGEKLKFATLAPKQSIWGQVFQVWEKAVKKKSDDKLEIVFDYNGSQGDEGAMAGKVKSGQLDGAAVTAVGLSKFHKPVLAMQMPGVLTSWAKVDKAISSAGPEFSKGLQDGGAYNLGWGFVGMAHVFTKGDGKVIKPGDLKSRKPYMWRDDSISPVLYQVVGATPVPLNVPEVLPNLKTGAIDTIVAPALAVEQLQWAGHLNGTSEQVVGPAVGALIMSNKRLESLPGDLRTIVKDTGAIAAKALTDKIKSEDSAAFDRMSKKLTTFKVDQGEFDKTFKEVRKRLAQGTFPADLVKKIEQAGGL